VLIGCEARAESAAEIFHFPRKLRELQCFSTLAKSVSLVLHFLCLAITMAGNVDDIENAPEPYPIVSKFELALPLNEPPITQSPPEKESRVEVKAPLDFEAEKIVILSFRGLQLGRISELQDELLSLSIISVSSEAISSEHKEKVDKVMAEYGS
jgi:hypothetical protein